MAKADDDADRMRRRALRYFFGIIAAYVVGAYLILPWLWKRYVRKHPSLIDVPGITHTKSGIHGDPLNVGLVGTENQVKRLLIAGGWFPADPLTLKSCLEIAEASVLKRPYEAAPVSNLYLFGRKEDLAFEQPVGHDPRKRHHVRFWKTEKQGPDDRPLWLGAATFDERVGLSETTGQITHHIDGNVDAERDFLFTDLSKTGNLSEVYDEANFHAIREGRNGGGDHWHTDGALRVGVIDPEKLR